MESLIQALGEICDDEGESPDCNLDCSPAVCGDGIVNSLAGEFCDDGNFLNGDGCTSNCVIFENNQNQKLALGASHSCSLSDSGQVRCWGDSRRGQLGYGNTESIGDDEQYLTAGYVDVGGTAVSIDAGPMHTCALLDTGHVRCWGYNRFGQLGYGHTEIIGDDETPASAGDIEIGGRAIAIAAGGDHSCALLDTGDVRCWGLNFVGQLGHGNVQDIEDLIGDDIELPPIVNQGDIDLGGSAVAITASHDSTCALLDTGNVRCWGGGPTGKLGYGNTDNIGDNESPSAAGDIDIGGFAVAIGAGFEKTCALLDTGNVRCWGAGPLGYGNTNFIGDDEVPAIAGDIDLGGSVVKMKVGGFSVCALMSTGNLRCWGSNGYGQLGQGNRESIGDDELPSNIQEVDLGGAVEEFAVGSFHVCAKLSSGEQRCFGDGEHGQLGYGNTNSVGMNELPIYGGAADSERSIVSIATGGSHSCVVLDTGNVRCWGRGLYSQLGYSSLNRENLGDNEFLSRVRNVEVGGRATALAAGNEHTCALLVSGDVQCWGSNYQAQLGSQHDWIIGDTYNPSFYDSVDIGSSAISLAAGGEHTCALLTGGDVMCWGSRSDGQLGRGGATSLEWLSPADWGTVDLGGTATSIAAGELHTCALLDGGGLRCWGSNEFGQLGYGHTDTIGDNEFPSSSGFVNVGGTATAIATGVEHTCALLDTGNVRCWGSSEFGQLGYGNTDTVGDNEVPATIGDIDLGGRATAITAGENHTCALLDTGNVRCWGSSEFGQLGYGNTDTVGDNEVPASMGDIDLGGTAVSIHAGKNHTCVQMTTASVRCWGASDEGQLGYNSVLSVGDDESPSVAGDVQILN